MFYFMWRDKAFKLAQIVVEMRPQWSGGGIGT